MNWIIKKFYFTKWFLLAVLLFTACQTQDELVVISLEEVRDDLYFQNLLDLGELNLGLTYLYQGNHDLDNQSQDLMKEQFQSALMEELPLLMEQGLWGDVQNSYVTLRNLDYPGLESIDYNEILFGRTMELLQSDASAAAAAILIDDINLERISDGELRQLEELFIQHRQVAALIMIAQQWGQRGQVPLAETENLISIQSTKEDMLLGTVTLWVDKGYRMLNGVGMPDRVIGSGFFIDYQGYLITNYHVIASEVDPQYEGYSRLYIKRNDREGEKIPARVIGWDPVMDIALVKTEMDVPYSFSFSQNIQPRLGDNLFAIGSPGGLEKTLTSGTVSSLARYLLPLGQSYQVDVPINPGNSGGPLLNEDSRVVGVVYAGIEEYEGINFAIPSNYAKDLLIRLYEGGEVQHSWLGLAVTKDLDKLLVSYSVPQSAAYLGGIQEGDQIISVMGNPVATVSDIQNIIFPLSPGTLVNLLINRNGEEHEIIIPLEVRPRSPLEQSLELDSRENLILPIFGMRVERAGGTVRRRDYRVSEVLPGSIADESGIVRNDNFRLVDWQVYPHERVLLMQIILQARSSGFMESQLQLGSWFDVNYFI